MRWVRIGVVGVPPERGLGATGFAGCLLVGDWALGELFHLSVSRKGRWGVIDFSLERIVGWWLSEVREHWVVSTAIVNRRLLLRCFTIVYRGLGGEVTGVDVRESWM